MNNQLNPWILGVSISHNGSMCLLKGDEIVDHLKELCPSDNLVFSGGVALNSVANEKVLFRGDKFENVFVMPAADDSGNSIGAAYYGLWQLTKENTKPKLIHDALGRKYDLSEIDAAITKTPAIKIYESEDKASATADLLAEGNVEALLNCEIFI